MGRKQNEGSVAAGRAQASGAGTDRRDESRGRFSAQRKAQAVLRWLRGEGLEALSRELGVTAATLSQWQEAFLSAGQAALWQHGGGSDEPGGFSLHRSPRSSCTLPPRRAFSVSSSTT